MLTNREKTREKESEALIPPHPFRKNEQKTVERIEKIESFYQMAWKRSSCVRQPFFCVNDADWSIYLFVFGVGKGDEIKILYLLFMTTQEVQTASTLTQCLRRHTYTLRTKGILTSNFATCTHMNHLASFCNKL